VVTRSGKRKTRSIAIRSRRSRAGVDEVLPGAGGIENLGSVGHLDDHLGTPTGEGVLAGLPGIDPLLQGMGG
jgi:hypothetical protein